MFPAPYGQQIRPREERLAVARRFRDHQWRPIGLRFKKGNGGAAARQQTPYAIFCNGLRGFCGSPGAAAARHFDGAEGHGAMVLDRRGATVRGVASLRAPSRGAQSSAAHSNSRRCPRPCRRVCPGDRSGRAGQGGNRRAGALLGDRLLSLLWVGVRTGRPARTRCATYAPRQAGALARGSTDRARPRARRVGFSRAAGMRARCAAVAFARAHSRLRQLRLPALRKPPLCLARRHTIVALSPATGREQDAAERARELTLTRASPMLLCGCRERLALAAPERLGDDRLRLGDDGLQVLLVAEAFRIDLVDILGA
jgi:hypothetical protein